MEDWELDFAWLRLRHCVQDRFQKKELPNLDAILYVTGIQEYGRVQEVYSKEEKQDLMHIAFCRLFEPDGFFEFVGIDDEGWPHYQQIKNIEFGGLPEQERQIKLRLVQYYAPLFESEENTADIS